MKGEVWKPIPGFDKYEVSSLGRLKSFFGLKPRILKPAYTARTGYFSVHLFKDKKSHTLNVHRLIGFSFGLLNGKEDPLFINHIDGDKKNNRLSNLERVTRSQNEKHAFRIGLKCHKGENHNQSKLTEEQVIMVYKFLKDGKMSAAEIGQRFGVRRETIYSIKHGRTWKHLYHLYREFHVK